MAISVVNLFVSLAGVKLDELDVLGNKFTVQNPHYLVASLWVAFFYWSIRYFQLLHDSGNLGIRDKYKDVVNMPTVLFIRPRFEARARSEMRLRNVPDEVEFWVSRMDWKVQPSMLLPFSPRILNCEAKYNYQKKRGEPNQRDIPKEWDLRPHYWLFFRSWWAGVWYVLFRSSLGTEYVLPPLLALGVLITCIVHAV